MDTINRPRPRPLTAVLALAIACVAFHGNAQARQDSHAPATQVMPQASALDAGVDLRPGQYIWEPRHAGDGPVVVVVSLPEQRAHVYRDGVRIGVSTISSGKKGKETPTGNFEILQKKRMHNSNLYNNAPMPFMQRLTWDGIALHAGALPGYPASMGCVRLPDGFARVLFEATRHGGRVVVADEASHGMAVVYPGARAPVDALTGVELPARNEGYASAHLSMSGPFPVSGK